MLNVQYHIESDSLLEMLTRLETAHTPEALAMFMAASVGPYLRERARRRFAQEGDDASGPWAPLSETTRQFRESMGYAPDHPINRRTDALYNYITGTQAGAAPTSDGGALLTFPGNPPSGETERKFKTAQYGRANPRTVPRPVLAVNEADAAFVTTALQDYIVAAARGVGE